MNRPLLWLVLGWMVCALWSLFNPVLAQSSREIPLARPGDRQFVVDRAQLIAPGDLEEIRRVADGLLTDQAIPIIVVTIHSKAELHRSTMFIDDLARALFNQWQIGVAKRPDGSVWNRGILLLVSKEDREARIQLGDGWGRGRDETCRQIMQTVLIPAFKQGDYSSGILAGVRSLETMARGQYGLKFAGYYWPEPWWVMPLLLLGALVALLTAVSLARSGSSGWAWLCWGFLFGMGAMAAAYAYDRMLEARLRRDSEAGGIGGGDSWTGDSWSGGSFGGGSSDGGDGGGGGGASGSW